MVTGTDITKRSNNAPSKFFSCNLASSPGLSVPACVAILVEESMGHLVLLRLCFTAKIPYPSRNSIGLFTAVASRRTFITRLLKGSGRSFIVPNVLVLVRVGTRRGGDCTGSNSSTTRGSGRGTRRRGKRSHRRTYFLNSFALRRSGNVKDGIR